jgi:hypothetical protein
MDKTTKLTSIGCGHLVLDAEVEQLLEKVSLLPHILVDSLMFYEFFSFTGLIKIGSFYIYLSYNGGHKGDHCFRLSPECPLSYSHHFSREDVTGRN